MDKYNTVCFLLSYGLDVVEIANRVDLTTSRVRTIIGEQRKKWCEIEKEGYMFTIDESGEIVKREFKV